MLLCRRGWVSLYSRNKDIVLAGEASARLAAQVDGQPRVRKKNRGTKGANRKKTGDQKAMEKKQGDRGGGD